jgi:branched-chain amino acid transport system substrate-binding protein
MTGEIKNLRRFTAIDRRAVVVRGLGMLAAPAVLRALPAEAQSKIIKIGHVSPRTGPLAGFGETDGFILDQVRGVLGKGLENGGKTYQVENRQQRQPVERDTGLRGRIRTDPAR